MKTYTHIIFDLDDTLLDFQAAQEEAFKQVLNQFQLPYTTEILNTYKRINMGLWHDVEKGILSREDIFTNRFFLFLKEYDITCDGLEVDKLYRGYLEKGYQIMDNAHEVLTALKANGIKLYAGTNGVGTTQRLRLEGAGLNGYFEDVFISEELGYEKPDKRFFDSIFAKIKTNKESAEWLMVGDSLTADIQGAVNAGIDCVWLNPMNVPSQADDPQSTHNIHSLTQLLGLIEIIVPSGREQLAEPAVY